ncbi:MAG: type IV pilus modification protein PilV [Proteobacteria bacterium]|nr:type IV pilus modification protein PilV [Pseudomonadota bacterium]
MNKNFKIKNNRGFTLIEALIAFFILSIGMLGIASLQAISLKAGKTSVYTSVATMKVDEVLESMRANPGALATYMGAGAANNCWDAAVCTEIQLAEDDVFLWQKNLKDGLPSTATGVVRVIAATAPSKMATVEITVSWKERNKTAAGSVDKSFKTTAYICTAVPC